MPSYTDRVTEIADAVALLPGAGVVHNRSRAAARWDEFAQRFVDGDARINGWQVSRQAAKPDEDQKWVEVFSLVKLRAVNDGEASDLAFQEAVDEAARAFAPQNPDGVRLSFGTVELGMVVHVLEERQFGPFLCHVAECTIEVAFYYSIL
jgi:hypothetical protein